MVSIRSGGGKNNHIMLLLGIGAQPFFLFLNSGLRRYSYQCGKTEVSRCNHSKANSIPAEDFKVVFFDKAHKKPDYSQRYPKMPLSFHMKTIIHYCFHVEWIARQPYCKITILLEKLKK